MDIPAPQPTPPKDGAIAEATPPGGAAAVDAAFQRVYHELRALAGAVGSGRASDTYSPTVLVHEAYLKLSRTANLQWQDQTHFMRLAARAMRQVLVDAATERTAQKRGGGEIAVTLTASVGEEMPLTPEALLELHEALGRLKDENERAAQVVECRYFGGMSAEETAEALGISVPTVARDWRFARAWLTRELGA